MNYNHDSSEAGAVINGLIANEDRPLKGGPQLMEKPSTGRPSVVKADSALTNCSYASDNGAHAEPDAAETQVQDAQLPSDILEKLNQVRWADIVSDSESDEDKPSERFWKGAIAPISRDASGRIIIRMPEDLRNFKFFQIIETLAVSGGCCFSWDPRIYTTWTNPQYREIFREDESASRYLDALRAEASSEGYRSSVSSGGSSAFESFRTIAAVRAALRRGATLLEQESVADSWLNLIRLSAMYEVRGFGTRSDFNQVFPYIERKNVIQQRFATLWEPRSAARIISAIELALLEMTRVLWQQVVRPEHAEKKWVKAQFLFYDELVKRYSPRTGFLIQKNSQPTRTEVVRNGVKVVQTRYPRPTLPTEGWLTSQGEKLCSSWNNAVNDVYASIGKQPIATDAPLDIINRECKNWITEVTNLRNQMNRPLLEKRRQVRAEVCQQSRSQKKGPIDPSRIAPSEWKAAESKLREVFTLQEQRMIDTVMRELGIPDKGIPKIFEAHHLECVFRWYIAGRKGFGDANSHGLVWVAGAIGERVTLDSLVEHHNMW